jgi:DNA-binding transcriptional ArsR family regulator
VLPRTTTTYPLHYSFVFAAVVVVVGIVTLLIGKVIVASGNEGSGGGRGNAAADHKYFDPRLKRLLWYLIGSTKGGYNRARILEFINLRPANANQIASVLKLDYKTVIHHLDVLSKNGLVITDNRESYGATYFLTPLLEKNYESLEDILAKIGKK